MVQAFSWCPDLLWGLLEVSPPKARSQHSPGRDLVSHPPLASHGLLCFLPGPALCGSSDSDAVLHLRSDRDAGRTAGPLLLGLYFSSRLPGPCSQTSPSCS